MRHTEDTSDSVFKRFSSAQKAKICGFCGVTHWNRVPLIWKAIEATKDKTELRDLMTAKWNKFKEDPNNSFTDMHWEDKLLKAIRTADFTQAMKPSFLTSAAKTAPLAFLQRTEDRLNLFEANRVARSKTTT